MYIVPGLLHVWCGCPLALQLLFLRGKERRRSAGHLHRQELWQIWNRSARAWSRHRLLAWAHTTRPRWACEHRQRQHSARYSCVCVCVRTYVRVCVYTCLYGFLQFDCSQASLNKQGRSTTSWKWTRTKWTPWVRCTTLAASCTMLGILSPGRFGNHTHKAEKKVFEL